MKKILTILACLLLVAAGAGGTFAKEVQPAKTLPAIVAQSCGQANTVIMWNDTNDDGKADYKATYIFKDGKLQQLNKGQATQDELGFLIRRRY